MATRSDVIPPGYLAELALLQDRISPFSTELARQVVEAEIGAPLSDVWDEWSEEPVAAASLGQVE